MLNKCLISLTLALTFIFTSAYITKELVTEKTSGDLTLPWQCDINLLHPSYKSQVIPDHLRTELFVFSDVEFNLMQVFEFLDHLSMSLGYQLAYAYFYQSSFERHPTLNACENPFYGTPDSTNYQKGGLDYVVAWGFVDTY